jgi:DNA-binding transcriptional MerR regulator
MPLPRPQRSADAESAMPAESRDMGPGGRRPEKSAAAFRTISEVATELDVPQHVLRFWETKFSQVRPLKRGGGRRYYRPEDVELLRAIRRLLYEEGYTIKGVQRLMREGAFKARVQETVGEAAEGVGDVAAPAEPEEAVPAEPQTAAASVRERAEAGAPGDGSGRELRRRELIEGAIEELTELRNRLAKLLG